jgi:hypothetical protein
MIWAAVNRPAMANCSIMPGAVCARAAPESLVFATAGLFVSVTEMGGSFQAARLCSKA